MYKDQISVLIKIINFQFYALGNAKKKNSAFTYLYV